MIYIYDCSNAVILTNERLKMTTLYLDIETIPSQLDWVKEQIAQSIKPTEPTNYPADMFAKNFETWKTYIQNGKKSADEIIKMVETKGKLTDEQRAQIIEVQPTVIDAETVNEPPVGTAPVEHDDDNPFN